MSISATVESIKKISPPTWPPVWGVKITSFSTLQAIVSQVRSLTACNTKIKTIVKSARVPITWFLMVQITSAHKPMLIKIVKLIISGNHLSVSVASLTTIYLKAHAFWYPLDREFLIALTITKLMNAFSATQVTTLLPVILVLQNLPQIH